MFMFNENDIVMIRYSDSININNKNIIYNKSLTFSHYNDIYIYILLGLSKYGNKIHYINQLNTKNILNCNTEYNYLNKDLTYKICDVKIENKKIIFWENFSTNLIKNIKGKILFLRGNYNNDIDYIKNFKEIIFYAAGVICESSCKYDKYVTIYLYDDKDSDSYKNASKRFKNSKKIQFIKFCKTKLVEKSGITHPIQFMNWTRDIDLLIITKEIKLDDNYKMIIELVKYMNINKINKKIICCGFKNKNDINNIKILSPNLNIEVKGIISVKELNILYNRSKNIFIPTIKDGNPRIISEAQHCGVNVIASNLLDSGKTQIKLCNGHVINYDINFYDNILNIINKKHDHNKIYNISKNLYNICMKNITYILDNKYNYNTYDNNVIYFLNKPIIEENKFSNFFKKHSFVINGENISVENIENNKLSSLCLTFLKDDINSGCGIYFNFPSYFIAKYNYNLPIEKYRFSFNAKITKIDTDFRFKIYTGIKYVTLEKEVTNEYQKFILEDEFNFNKSSTYRIGFVNPKKDMELFINNPLIKLI